jgi:large conductance mechanosensitive channel
MPLLGAASGGLDFSNYFLPLSSKVTAGTLAEARKEGAVLAWGSFLTIVLNFLIISWSLFLAIRVLSRLQKTKAEPAPPSAEALLLTEIRDLLKKQ